MQLILESFERCIPPSYTTFYEVIKRAGGVDAAIQSPSFLHTLIERERLVEHTPDVVVLYGVSRPSRTAPPVFPTPVPSVERVADSSRPMRSPGHSTLDYSHTAESQGWGRRTLSWRPYTDAPKTPPLPASVPARSIYPDRNASLSKLRGYRVGEDLEQQEITMLRQELSRAPSADIKKNFEVFEKKFEIQTRELAEEMKKFVAHEGDRVISTVLDGPHERIIDPVCL